MKEEFLQPRESKLLWIGHLASIKVSCEHSWEPSGYSEYSYPISRGTLMSVAHSCTRKTQHATCKASAINPARVEAISDSRAFVGAITHISSHLHLIARPSTDYSDLHELSNLSTDRSLPQIARFSDFRSSHRLSGTSHRTPAADRTSDSPHSMNVRKRPVTSPFLA